MCLLLLVASGCAGGLYGGVKTDAEGLKRVKKVALISYTTSLPIEGSGGFGLVRIGALDEGGMFRHGLAIVTDAAERFDNELQQGLTGMEYISLATVREDDLYKILAQKDQGNVVAARGTADLIRSATDINVPASQKIAAKIGADAVILVHNTIRFFKHTGWFATIDPAAVRIYSSDGRLLLQGQIRFTSERWDIDRSTELDLSEEQRLLKEPVEKTAQWLIKALRTPGS